MNYIIQAFFIKSNSDNIEFNTKVIKEIIKDYITNL